MSTSDVRSIESLERFRQGLLKLADDWEKTLQEIRISVHRAQRYYTDEVPRYWRHQTELAERELTESKDELQRKQAAARASDRVSALEAQKRVARAKERLDLCRQRQRVAKSLSIEISHQCDEMLGPLADMTDHSETQLPAAAAKLQRLLDALHRYTDASSLPRLDDPAAADLRSGDSSTGES
ncbi:hypothetical protein [Rhodopirellula sp. MGV]|uniref:hypothetical protein n=1 Tax=Rhodopirellula sp. MGV TaxID=2023130 RepID=UPI000B9689AB|nr:hypothetical protein [Rhodopirellula sp. MGV]PNY36943.1 hypothetical protein C2E31_10020 [Rhodopirellula baltica]